MHIQFVNSTYIPLGALTYTILIGEVFRCSGRPLVQNQMVVTQPNPSFLTSIQSIKKNILKDSFNPQNLFWKYAKWSKWHQRLNNFWGWTFKTKSWKPPFSLKRMLLIPFLPLFATPIKAPQTHGISTHRSLTDRLRSLRASAPQALTWQQRPCWGRSKEKRIPSSLRPYPSISQQWSVFFFWPGPFVKV